MTTVSQPSAQLSAPRTFGRYQLFERIGAGGMAEIFLARARTELGGARLVVVKQILPALSGNEKFAEMLITEAKLAARLSHANVVQVFDLGRHESVLFIAMEYIEGFDLNDLLRRCARSGVPLPIDFSLLVAMEALRGLGYAHRLADDAGAPLGIVHRDVSPSNVLISFEGEVKLCDFGIARANDIADLLSEDVIKGKASYMSPEQARGNALDARADLFALGIVLWELLSGRKLYKVGSDGRHLLDLARAAEIPPIPTRGLPFESDLHGIVGKALATNVSDRYPTAQSMLRDLEDYVARARLVASPIRFGEWVRDNFGENIVEARRARERAATALERGPAVVIRPLDAPAPRPSLIAPPMPPEPPAELRADTPLPPVVVPPRFSFAAYLAIGACLGVVAILAMLALR